MSFRLIMLNKIKFFLINVLVSSYISWFLAQIYIYICAPDTLWGFLISPIYMGSPVCKSIAYFQYELSNFYTRLWFSFTIMVTSKKMFYYNNNG